MKLYFTVTTDLTYDQRMIRICTSLTQNGYEVVLVGRKLKNSLPITEQHFKQKRINCFFEKGKLFYAEYNVRLFFYLLFKKMDCICAIDLDTILPCYCISVFKCIPRVYDAHELFCEMKEVVSRATVYKIWKKIERFAVPKFTAGYTVNQPIADEFTKMYGIKYAVIRNIALLIDTRQLPTTKKYILYQGAVNEGRSFETLIPAMKNVNSTLVIVGDGNFMEQAIQLTKENHLEDTIIFKGKILPDELRAITQHAHIGITLFDDTGLSNYYSLANRFFDYMQAGIPQLCVDYPAYRELNEALPIALLIKDISKENIAMQLNHLLNDTALYNELQKNCQEAKKIYNWQVEEKRLLAFYHDLFLINNGR
ncbi:MAG TPA: glycosyltransferase [Ferruginibacter sp.]|jgi:glycosyltransferase involved in cell wall biosynthesis|nr:glycosyltransferase [Ferruginibacter sp.]